MPIIEKIKKKTHLQVNKKKYKMAIVSRKKIVSNAIKR